MAVRPRRKDKADLSDIYVQMKLTEIDSGSDQAAELIRNISKSSNSQSKVSDADFFSTHAFHIRMEQISRRLFAPAVDGNQYETHWFYERARGQYVQLQMAFTKAEIEKFKKQNPKEQRVTKTDLAKFRNSWDCYPHIVSKGADASFSFFAEIIDAAWEKNSDAFNDKYFKDSMALAKLFKEIEVLVTNQPWYDKGYRANIVTYSIAIFRHLLNKLAPKKNFDLSVIWNRQKVPAEVINEFKKITFFVKEQITDPSRGTANVTQWCKRENCWEKMKAAAEEEFDLLTIDNIDDYLLSADEEKSQVRQAKSAQKDISEAEAQAAVWEMGAPFWMQIEKFVLEKRLGSPEMRKALWPATRAKLPSPYQAKRLLELLELAKEEGFKAVEENGEY